MTACVNAIELPRSWPRKNSSPGFPCRSVGPSPPRCSSTMTSCACRFAVRTRACAAGMSSALASYGHGPNPSSAIFMPFLVRYGDLARLAAGPGQAGGAQRRIRARLPGHARVHGVVVGDVDGGESVVPQVSRGSRGRLELVAVGLAGRALGHRLVAEYRLQVAHREAAVQIRPHVVEQRPGAVRRPGIQHPERHVADPGDADRRRRRLADDRHRAGWLPPRWGPVPNSRRARGAPAAA